MEVQTRNQEGELRYFATEEDAFNHACKDPTVWKISFDTGKGFRMRLIRQLNGVWLDRPLLREMDEALGRYMHE